MHETSAHQLSHQERFRYRKLWIYSFLLVSLISLIPLVFLTIIGLHEYQRTLTSELRLPVSRLLANAQKALEFIINERQHALTMLIGERSVEDLQHPHQLARTFENLRTAFKGFVDLGLIDAQGNQISYTGPYNLQGKNYKDQFWFHEVSLRDIYVSEVFMGYRNFPHFVIAVKHAMQPGDFYVLRATIDMQLLNQQLQALYIGPASDAFLLNAEGVLQTNSRFHGKILEPCTLPHLQLIHQQESEVIEEISENQEDYFLGYSYIPQTPFVLVFVPQQRDLMKNWMGNRHRPVWFLIGSSIVILLVNLGGTTYMVSRVRAADVRRARAYHSLEYTNKMASIGRLATSVAHEINNPLAIINEKIGLLKDMVEANADFTRREKVLGLADSILRSVERGSTITQRLLGFARRLEGRIELIQLETLIKEVLGFLGKEFEHRNVSVHFEVAENFPPISSDRGLLQQVFLNIITNAQAALNEGGGIRFILQEDNPDRVSVKICDTGKGIAPEDLRHIFEPFFSTKGEFGTGLGLSITYDIVTKLGGQINVASEPGAGTCFTILLPKHKA